MQKKEVHVKKISEEDLVIGSYYILYWRDFSNVLQPYSYGHLLEKKLHDIGGWCFKFDSCWGKEPTVKHTFKLGERLEFYEPPDLLSIEMILRN